MCVCVSVYKKAGRKQWAAEYYGSKIVAFQNSGPEKQSFKSSDMPILKSSDL